MALQSPIVVSGAGDSTVNGTYTLQSGNNSQGDGPYYTGPNSNQLVWSADNGWGVGGAALVHNGAAEYRNTGGSDTTFPTTGWNVGSGTDPIPTFTALPSPIAVSGAGTTGANGTYTLQSGNDPNGFQYYKSATNYGVVYNNNFTVWEIITPSDLTAWLASAGASPADLYAAENSYSSGPVVGGWGKDSGTDPAPTVTAGSSAMTLNAAGYTASTAGTSSVNSPSSNFVPVTGANATYNGVTQFTNGAIFACWATSNAPDAPCWLITDTVNQGGTIFYQNPTGSTTSFPLTSWDALVGNYPAPTFTAIMALPSPLVVSGAGDTDFNGTYSVSSGTDSNGNKYYQLDASHFIQFDPGGPQWELTKALGNSDWYKCIATGQTATTFPVGSTWVPDIGGGPGPTINAGSSAPVTPTGVTATAAAGLQVTVNQAATEPGGTTYNVLDSATSGSESLVASGVSLPFTYTASAPGTRYVKLQAVNGGTTSASSAEASVFAYGQQSGASNPVTVTPNVANPSAVTGLTGVLADSGTAPNPTLGWTLPVGGQAPTATGVFIGTTPGGEGGSPFATLAANATSYVHTAAAYNADYYYQVGTQDASGNWVLSGELHLKTDTAAPTNLVGVAGNGQVVLTWTNSTGTLGIAVERSADGGTTWGTLTTLSSALGTYTDTTPTNGTAYKYRVRDIN